MIPKDKNFYQYKGRIYLTFIVSKIEVGVIDIEKVGFPKVNDLELMPKQEWINKSRKISKNILKRLIVQVPK